MHLALSLFSLYASRPPPNISHHSYVLLTAATTSIIGVWHGFRVGGFRKAAKITYPQPYAFSNATSSEIDAASTAEEKARATNNYLFNCAQRSHGNFLENFPIFLPALLTAGLRWPVASSVLGALWGVSRIVYAVGYTRVDKKNGSGRLYGSLYALAQLALIGMVGKMGWDVAMV